MIVCGIVLSPTPIASVALIPQELPKDCILQKGAFLDIMAQLDNGTRIDIEMQVLFYWA
jgi:hypothetical protein